MKKDLKKIKNEVMDVAQRTTMQTQHHVAQVPLLPLPVNEQKRLMQAEVNLELFEAVSKVMKKKDLKIRAVMEWGLRAYLLATDPKEAAKLGIKAAPPDERR